LSGVHFFLRPRSFIGISEFNPLVIRQRFAVFPVAVGDNSNFFGDNDPCSLIIYDDCFDVSSDFSNVIADFSNVTFQLLDCNGWFLGCKKLFLRCQRAFIQWK